MRVTKYQLGLIVIISIVLGISLTCQRLLVTPSLSNKKTIESPVSHQGDCNSFLPLSNENQILAKHTMNVGIRTDLSIKVLSEFVLFYNTSETLENFFFTLRYEISSVYCYDPLGPLDFTLERVTDSRFDVNVSLRHPINQEYLYFFSIEYIVEDNNIYLLQEVQNDALKEYYSFDFRIYHPRFTESFTLKITLPTNWTLIPSSYSAYPTLPEADRIEIENAVLTAIWNLENTLENNNNFFTLRFIKPDPIIITEPSNFVEKPIAPLFFILTFLGGVVSATVALLLFYRLKMRPARSDLVSSLLTESEQEVIKAINAEGGTAIQRKICEHTDFSKSKVSQLLKKLEQKKILTRERWGRTNRVTIINPVFETISEEKTNSDE